LVAGNDAKWSYTGEGATYISAKSNATAWNNNDWHFMCFTFNNTSKLLTFYLDGVLDDALYLRAGAADDGVARCTIASTDRMYFGCGYKDGSLNDDFVGNVDELSIWDKILEPEHINDLYAAGVANTSKNSGFADACYTNVAINAGVTFAGSFGTISKDLVDTNRANPPTIGAYEYSTAAGSTWAYEEGYAGERNCLSDAGEPRSKFGGDHTINKFYNVSSNYDRDIIQVPYFVVTSTPGPVTMRGTKTAYVATRSNPSLVVSGTS
jgi:hypothetical protein